MKERQKLTGRKVGSAKKRTKQELFADVGEWIEKKYLIPKKKNLRQELCPGKWNFEFVVHKVRHPEELETIGQQGIKVHRLSEIVEQLRAKEFQVPKSAGADLIELVLLGEETLK